MSKAPAVDSGWSWVVMCAALMAHIITHGFIYSFGIYFIAIGETYNGSKAAIAWIPSIITGSLHVIGPFSSSLVNKFGCQRVGTLGAGLAFLGLFLSLFAPNIYILYLTMGLVTGAGIGLIFLPSVLSVTIYFNKYRGIACGMALSGCGIGSFVFSPLSEYMLQEYGLKGTLLINSGIMLNCLPCCLMYRTLNLDQEEPITSADKECNGSETYEEKLSPKNINSSQLSEQSVSLLNGNSEESSHIETGDLYLVKGSKFRVEMSRVDEKNVDATFEISTDKSDVEIITEQRKNHEKDIKFSAEDSTLTRYMMLMKRKHTLLFFVSQFLFISGTYIPFIFIPDKAKLHDIEEKNSAWVASAIGISSITGRVILGYLADRDGVNRKLLFKITLILSGLSTAFCPWLNSFELLLVYAVLYGIVNGTTVSLTSVVLLDIVGITGITDAIGLNYMFSGLGGLIGPPLAGLLYDLTQSYTSTFVFSGVAMATAGFLLVCS